MVGSVSLRFHVTHAPYWVAALGKRVPTDNLELHVVRFANACSFQPKRSQLRSEALRS